MKLYNGNTTIYPSGAVNNTNRDSPLWSASGSKGVFDTFDTTSADEYASWSPYFFPGTIAFFDFGNPSCYNNAVLTNRNISLDFSPYNNQFFWSGTPSITTTNPRYATVGQVGTLPSIAVGSTLGTNFCAGFWLRPNMTRYAVLCATNYNGGGIEFRRNGDNVGWECYIGSSGRNAAVVFGISMNVWAYFTWTFDGATFRGYRNGALVASTNWSGTIANANTLRVFYGYGDSQYGGDVGLFHFGFAASDATISSYFEATRGRFGV